MTKSNDWAAATGRQAEIRLGRSVICSGLAGAVNDNGTRLWIQPYSGQRRAFSKADGYEVWIAVRPF
ncbi:hypothetical protein RBS60_11540 [Sinomonas sp. ASV486]|uniref:hypothetical protein n=1 Tax=Sinomonas sp. ASV486 TaxID=3051170 RepID=UPI0027DC9397|nr:hypothetical protein [Sinomonas sp. ASV486]MDQ4490828.1 hypothetical protein [Sinomonas sp. ASV486]